MEPRINSIAQYSLGIFRQTLPFPKISKMVTACSTASQYDQTLKENTLVIVDFHATWCGPCKQISPKFAQFSGLYKEMVFISIDVDEVPEIAERAEVRERRISQRTYSKNA